MRFRKRYGFTLIELLGVIVIIGVLASISYATYHLIFDKSELSAGYAQADKIQEVVAMYMADNGGDLPLEVPNADYISKPAKIDLSKISSKLNGKPKGTFYIYGGAKEVYFDYPTEYIQKVYDSYPNKVEIVIAKESRIDTDLLHSKNLLDYKAFTNYILMGDGTIIQTLDRGKVNSASDGPSKPVIIPSKLAPYYSNDSISFTATSYSPKGDVNFEWTNAVENVGKIYPIGKNIVKVTAIDKDGNRSETSTFEFDVVSTSTINKPPSTPVITVNPSKTSYVSSENISLSATATDPEGDSLTYIWIGKSENGYYGRGTHDISVYAMDSKNNTSPKATKTLVVTNGSPVISNVSFTPDPAYIFDNIKFKVNAKDYDGDLIRYEWRMDKNKDGIKENYSSLEGKYPIGTYTAEVRAIDSFGAASNWFPFNFKVTNRNPSIPTFDMTPSPTSNIYGNTPISFTYCCSVDPDGDKNITYETVNFKSTYPFVVGTTNPSQTITAKVRAKDSFGGYSDYATITFTVLNTVPTKPSISMSPASTSDLRSNTPITFTPSGSSDTVDKDSFVYEYEVNNSGLWSTSVQKTFPVGSHVVKVRARDIRGGLSPETSISFTINNTPPTQPIVRPINSIGSYGKTSNIGFQLGSTSSDVDSDSISYEYNANGGTWGTSPPNQQFTSSPQYTTNTVQVRAKDSRGAYSSTYSYKFAWRDPYYTTELDQPAYTYQRQVTAGYWDSYGVWEVTWCYGREPGTVGPMYSHAPPCDWSSNEIKSLVTYEYYVEPTYETVYVPATYYQQYHSGYWYQQ